jgi:ribosomal protein S18 acetylase RimI-like enzyme
MIRPARADDLPLLAAIEAAAAELFRGTAMAFVLELPVAPAKAPLEIAEPVLIWVAADHGDRPVGFLEAEIIEGWLHVLELSVHPDGQRQGLGRALMAHAAAAARVRGLARVSLTTDREIAWNGPAYRRMGFSELAPASQPDWLAAILSHEVEVGFDPARRVAMAKAP